MNFQSPLSQLIPQSQDPNENPFFTAIKILNSKLLVKSDAGVAATILVSVVTYCAIIVVCIFIICLPRFQGADGHARRYWIIKRHYLDGHRKPYWVPNSGLIVAVCHLTGSTIFLVFLVRRYHALTSALQGTTIHESAWLEMRWFPAYCSFFTQAWSTWFVRASNASLKGRNKLGVDPILFNTNLIALPVGVFSLAMVLVSGQAVAVKAQDESIQKLFKSLRAAATLWEGGGRSISSQLFKDATSDYSNYLDASGAAILSIRAVGLFWTLMGIPTIIMYVFGVSTLLSVIRKRAQAVHTELENQTFRPNRFSFVQPTVKRKKSPRNFNNSFIYLGLHYFSMSMVLLFHIIIGLVYYLASPESLSNQNFQEVFLILSDSGSFLLLIALLVQLVRIILEGREPKGITSKMGDKNSEHADISLMT